MMNEAEIRQQIVESIRHLNKIGINQGVSGNISARYKDAMLITPTGIPYDVMQPEDLAVLPFGGEYGDWEGPYQPSSEWRFHYDILDNRPDIHGVIHNHPTFCTALSMTRKPIPACHYMINIFGGSDVRCAGYATYGTAELSALALKALENRMACLLANHGAIALGETLEKAMWRAVELETIARQYYYSLMLPDAVLLSEEEIKDVFRQRSEATYGLRSKE